MADVYRESLLADLSNDLSISAKQLMHKRTSVTHQLCIFFFLNQLHKLFTLIHEISQENIF